MYRYLGVALGAMVALTAIPAASAAVLSTQTVNFSFSLTDTQQNLTGTAFPPTFQVQSQQAVTFNRIAASQNLTSVTITQDSQFAFAYAVSQQGGTGPGLGDGISFIANTFLQTFTANEQIGEAPQALDGPVLCSQPLCFAPKGGTNPSQLAVFTLDAADDLALFEGDGTADVILQLFAFYALGYETRSALEPVFGFSYNFTVTGSLTLVFEGDGPNPDPDPPAGVPEPMGAGLLLAGLGFLAARRRAAAR